MIHIICVTFGIIDKVTNQIKIMKYSFLLVDISIKIPESNGQTIQHNTKIFPSAYTIM